MTCLGNYGFAVSEPIRRHLDCTKPSAPSLSVYTGLNTSSRAHFSVVELNFIRWMRASPETRLLPLIALGSHCDPDNEYAVMMLKR